MLYYKELPELDATTTILETTEYLHKYTNCFSRTGNYIFDGINVNFAQFTENVPSCQPLFSSLGLIPVRYMIFILGSTEVAMHRDTNASRNSVRINIPILNCEHSETLFFKMKPGVEYSPNIIAGDYEFADKLILRHPTALAVGKAHQVRMLEDRYPRISLSVFFEEDTATSLLCGADGED